MNSILQQTTYYVYEPVYEYTVTINANLLVSLNSNCMAKCFEQSLKLTQILVETCSDVI